jgi:hypothetical protein
MSVYYVLTVCLDNAAFWNETGPDPGPELARVLRNAADIAENHGPGSGLTLTMHHDSNGNICGDSRIFRARESYRENLKNRYNVPTPEISE